MEAAKSLEGITGHQELAKNAGEESLARLDKFRHARGNTPTAVMRNAMQRAMQEDAAVFPHRREPEERPDPRAVISTNTLPDIKLS